MVVGFGGGFLHRNAHKCIYFMTSKYQIHHTVSDVALVGGGQYPQPREITFKSIKGGAMGKIKCF